MAARVQLRDITSEEGNRLLQILRRTSGSVVTWRRAQIVLLSAQGMSPPAISEVVFTDPDTVRDVSSTTSTGTGSTRSTRAIAAGGRRRSRCPSSRRPSGSRSRTRRTSTSRLRLGACPSSRITWSPRGWSRTSPQRRQGARRPRPRMRRRCRAAGRDSALQAQRCAANRPGGRALEDHLGRGEVSKEARLGLPAKTTAKQVCDLADDKCRHDQRPGVRFQQLKARLVVGIVAIHVGIERAGVNDQRDRPNSAAMICSTRSETSECPLRPAAAACRRRREPPLCR